jgi:FtsH-binding integral membrane protein
MSNYERNVAAPGYDRPLSRAEAGVIDAGLRAYMLRIYNYMVLGLAITGLAALGIYMLSVTGDASAAAQGVRALRAGVYLTPIGYAMFVSPLKWVVMLAPLAMIFVISFGIEKLSTSAAHVLFWVFAALIGLSLGSIFLVYTHTSIVRVFFITAASFGALSLWGYTTQRELSGFGSFLIMGLFGVIIASLVNLFLQSSALQFIVSVIGVLVFAGLTAWDTQRLKSEYIYGRMEGAAQEKAAIMGALSLYLNFINLFTLLLNLFGQREE